MKPLIEGPEEFVEGRSGGIPLFRFVALFWILLAAVSTLQTYYFYALMPSGPSAWRALVMAGSYSLLWALATPLVLWLAGRFPIERGNAWRSIPLHLGLSMIVGVAHRLAWLYLHKFLPSVFDRGDVTWSRAMSDLVTSFDYQAMVYWVLLAIHQGFHYYRKYQEGRVRSARLAAQLLEARLAGLKTQLAPHFLFNTLHTINAMMFADVERASEMLVRLSEFLRLSLENTGSPEVELERELDFIDRYLEIERCRFEERLNVEFHIEPGTETLLVPNLLLQPIVENAIKHGIGRMPQGGYLRISSKAGNDWLEIFVANNGPSLTSDPFKEPAPEEATAHGGPCAPRLGIGLRNARERLRALYGDRFQLELVNNGPHEVEARIRVPVRRSQLGADDDVVEKLTGGLAR